MSQLYIHIAIHKTLFSSWKQIVHEHILGCNQSFEKSSLPEDPRSWHVGKLLWRHVGPLVWGTPFFGFVWMG